MDKNISIIILGIFCIFLLWFHSCEAKNFKEENALLKAANDSIIKTKNPDGSETSRIALLQASNSEMLLKLDSKDRTIRELQVEVKKNKDKIKEGGSVTVINTNTEFIDSVKTKATFNFPVKDSLDCNPTYNAKNQDTIWIKWKIKSNKFNTDIELTIRDKFSVVIGSERVGLFKRKPIVEVTTSNPYNSVKSMRAFEVKDTRSHKISLGLQGGYGITLHGFSPYIGIGFNFKIL